MTISSIKELIDGRDLVAVAPQDSIQTACDVLARENIGALAVVVEGRLAGILSERDIIRRCYAKGLSGKDMQVAELMTPTPKTVGPDGSLAEALQAMMEGGFRYVPVTDGSGRAVGMVSMRDIPTSYRMMVERFRDHGGVGMAAH